MADANPTLYASAFGESRSPPLTFHPISLRLSLERALTRDLAGYFRERLSIEQDYINSLERLEARLHDGGKASVFHHLDSFHLDELDRSLHLGRGLTQVQQTLERELGQLVKLHKGWHAKLATQVERALAESVGEKSDDWTRWDIEEKRIALDVKEYESLVDKVSKAESKQSQSSKVHSKLLSTQSSLASLGSSLQTEQLPRFLTDSQRVELTHVRLVKQVLTQYATFGTDLARDRMQLGEDVVQTVLNVDEGVEMQEWALREGQKASVASPSTAAQRARQIDEFGASRPGGGGATAREREESTVTTNDADSLAPSIATTTRGGGTLEPTPRERTTSRLSMAPPVAPLALPGAEDSRSINSSSNNNATTSTTTPSKSKSSKKLGSKISSFLSGGSKKDKDKDKQASSRDRSSSIPNSARYTNNLDNTDTNPPVPASSSDRVGLAAPARPNPIERNSSNGSDLLGGSTRAGEGNGSFQPPLEPTPVNNNNNKRESSLFSSSSTRAGRSSGGGGLFRRQSRMNSIPDDYNDASPPVAVADGGRRDVDSEGFSVPPQGYDRAIGTAAAPSGSRNLMDDDDDDDEGGDEFDGSRPVGDRGVPKLNILPASAPSPSTIASPSFAALSGSPVLVQQESEEERLAALSAIKNSLGAPPETAGGSGGLNRRATARGRRSEAGAGSNRPTSMLPSAAAAAAAGGASAATLAAVARGGVERRETDDDVPLATIQQESRRKAPPPPPPPAASSNLHASPLSSPTSPGFPAPTSVPPVVSSSSSSAVNNKDPSRAMSILSTTSSSVVPNNNSKRRDDPFEGIAEPGVRVSVVEQVNVLMRQGQVQRVLVTGEIAISYRPSSKEDDGDGEEEDEGDRLWLTLTNSDRFEKSVPNSNFVVRGGGGGGRFELSKRALRQTQGRTVPVFKYQLDSNSRQASAMVPLIAKPTWRCEPNLTRIIVVYSRNPEFFKSTSTTTSPFGEEEDDDEEEGQEFEELKLKIPFKPGQVGSFQSKPPSIGRLVDKAAAADDDDEQQQRQAESRIEFSLPRPPLRGDDDEMKLLVSCQTQGVEPTARVSNASVEWRIRGRSISQVGVSIEDDADQGKEDIVCEVRREIKSGKYMIA